MQKLNFPIEYDELNNMAFVPYHSNFSSLLLFDRSKITSSERSNE